MLAAPLEGSPMMGERNPKNQLWSYQMIIRYDELRRHWIWIFVRREVAKCYGIKGNVSEDPVVIMKMMLLLVFGQRA
jgi:hypothetical protein